MKRKFVVAACVIAVFGTVCGCTGDRKDPVDYVNPCLSYSTSAECDAQGIS